MRIPEGYHFTKSHEFCKIEAGQAVIGLSDYAQSQLGDITFVELPEVGDEIEKGESCGTVEAVKAASDIYAPISGKVIEINEELEDTPELINEDTYEKGWLFKLELNGDPDLSNLMDSATYETSLD